MAAQWLNNLEFKDLGKSGLQGEGSAGLVGNAKFKIEYKGGKFHATAGMGLAVGLGCGGCFSFELDVEEGCAMMGFLLNSVDFHFVGEIEKSAFKAYESFTFTVMTEGREVVDETLDWARDAVEQFSVWAGKIGKRIGSIKQSIGNISTSYGTLSKYPPETLGKSIRTVMRVWEDGDEDVIMGILISTIRRDANFDLDPNANHKLKSTLRRVYDPDFSYNENAVSDEKKGEALVGGVRMIRGFFEKGSTAAQLMIDQKLNPFLSECKIRA